MSDIFTFTGDSPMAPARRCFAITPHDSTPLPYVTKALRAEGNGVITLRTMDGEADVAHPVKDGERIDVRATHVRLTGTTVSVIGYA